MLDRLDLRLLRAMRGLLAEHRAALATQTQRLAAQGPQRRLELLRQRLGALPGRLQLAWRQQHARRIEHLAGCGRELHAVSPLATLQRGYSVLRHGYGGGVVSRVEQLHQGDRIEALLADGRADLTVDRVDADSAAEKGS
jgi:exodeoxyribonuclease VII large subunit